MQKKLIEYFYILKIMDEKKIFWVLISLKNQFNFPSDSLASYRILG